MEGAGFDKELQSVTLDSLGNGAAKQMFQAELERAIENILDPNVGTKGVRKVVLELRIHPTDDGEIGNCEIFVNSKLQDGPAYATRFYIGRENGRVVAYESNPKQLTLEDEAKSKVVGEINEEGGE